MASHPRLGNVLWTTGFDQYRTVLPNRQAALDTSGAIT